MTAILQASADGDGRAQGRLRLGAWAGYSGDPLLPWTARQVADGWMLETAALR